MRPRWSPHWHLIAACLAAAGTALKLQQWYFSRPLWLDEEMVLLNVRDRSFAELASPLWLDQAAPIGWLWVQRALILAFGTDDRAVRALPVLMGIGTLWAAWWMARRLLTPLAAAILVGLCGIGQWITFYALEVKPYSADAFAATLLMAVAFWATEDEGQPLSLRRTAVWWGTAAVAQWFAFGATLATPACALVLTVEAWRRAGSRPAALVACQGIVWLICFGVHYELSMRAASHDSFLRTYWAYGFPPADAGLTATLTWLSAQAAPLASHPGGTYRWVLFYLTAAYGCVVLMSISRAAGFIVLLVPITGATLSALRLVPMADRLALWMVPALYVSVAVAGADAAERVYRFRQSRTPRESMRLALAVAFSAAAVVVSYDIVSLGRSNLITRGANHGFDDGRAVRLLARQREPGDAWLGTHFSLPAVWWYGDISIGPASEGGNVSPDGGRLFQINHTYYSPDCQQSDPLRDLRQSLRGISRVSVYLGFDSEVPPGFQELALNHLSRLGARVAYRGYGAGLTAIYDLRQPPDIPSDATPAWLGQLDGCVSVRPARRW